MNEDKLRAYFWRGFFGLYFALTIFVVIKAAL